MSNFSLVPLGLLADWDLSSATRGATSVTDTSGNSCVLTASTGARISGARDGFQGATGKQPPYTAASGSTPAYITTDGADDYIKSPPFSIVQPATIYDVFKMVSHTVGDVLADGNAANSGALVQTTASPKLSLNAGSSACENSDAPVGSFVIGTTILDGAASSFAVNGGTPVIGNAGTAAMNGCTIGADGAGANASNAQWCARAIYSGRHSAATQRRIRNYLSRQHNLGI